VSDQSNSTGIQLGAEMLVDRACLGVGSNAGNGVVLGSPLRPHVNATSVIVGPLFRRGAGVAASGVELNQLNTADDLQSGFEEAQML
jgi:hypothetical protein